MHKIFVISLFWIAFIPNSSLAKTANLFTLHRINYKAFKQLRYDISYDQSSCTINTKRPLDVFYENIATGERISKFSSNSRKYFAPSWKASQISPREFSFSFKALNEIKQLLGSSSRLKVYLDSVGGKCQITTEVSYPGISFDLRHITVDVKLAFGIPIGVHSVELKGVRNGSYFSKKIKTP